MLLHGISNAEIVVGDTLSDPKFKQYGMLSTFDVCVANPPFSMKNWFSSGMEIDPYNRWTANLLPPAKCGDYAFLMHLIASMKADEGRGACILPHGVLFRGNAEYNIRREIVSRHYIKGIIGLPPNIFFGTGIPASIIVIDKKDKESRRGIFFIDAKDGFMKDGAKNRLREQDIKRIVDAWEAMQPIPHFCRMVEWDEIEKNDYNLNIPRYIQPIDNEVQHDIEAHLHGGIPVYDIAKMEIYWKTCPTLRDNLFIRDRDGYYSLKPAKKDIIVAINNDSSYKQQGVAFAEVLDSWKEDIRPKMFTVGQGSHPKELIAAWSESLLEKTKGHSGLVDAYDAYDVLMNYWAEVMQDDCYMISNDGWTYPEVKAVKRKEKKDKKGNVTGVKDVACAYDEIVCDLLPVDIVLMEYFVVDTAEISDIQLQIDSKQAEMDELVEQNSDTFVFSDENEDEDEEKTITVKAADVKRAIRNAKNGGVSDEELAVLKNWLILSTQKDALSKTLKQKRGALTNAVVKKYAALTEDEIKMLVVERKWLATIIKRCDALMQTVTRRIGADVTALVERYETTLPELVEKASGYEKEVNAYLAEMGFTL